MKNLALVVFIAVGALSGCPKNGPGPVIGSATIDCLGTNRDSIDAILNEFKPLIAGGKVNWSAVYTRGKQAGRDVGTCFVLEMTNLYLGGGNRAGEEAEAIYANAQKFRDENAQGMTVRTKCLGEDGSMNECRL